MNLFRKKTNINLSNLISENFIESNSANYLSKIIYVLFFVILYIGNQHFVEKRIRQINTMEKKVEELKTYYVTTKNNYIFSKKESEVLKRVRKIQLEASDVPPEKINLEK